MNLPNENTADLRRLEQGRPAPRFGGGLPAMLHGMRFAWIFVSAAAVAGLTAHMIVNPNSFMQGSGYLGALALLTLLFLIREERRFRAARSDERFLWHRLRDFSQIFEVVLGSKTEQDLRLLSGLGLQEAMLLLRSELGAIAFQTSDEEDYVSVLGFENPAADHRPWLVELQSLLSGLKVNCPIFVSDMSKDPLFRDAKMMRKAGIGSFAAVKFCARWGVEGLLIVGNAGPCRFRAGDDKTMHLSARQVGAIAMHGRELEHLSESMAELRRENDELTYSNQLKSEFASVASHELRTPLTAVKASVDALLSNVISGDYRDLEEFLLMIREEADRLIEMTGKILENSEQDYGNRHMERRAARFQRIVDSCKKALEVHLQEKDMQLSVRIPQDLPDVFADPGMIRQVLINLISNAVKFSKSGQTITVEARAKNDRVEICVSDQGMGIPIEEQPHVFDRFYQGSGRVDEHAQGTGLGLAIVKQIVEQHDGKIAVGGKPGEGAVFTFDLPLARNGFGLEGSSLDRHPRGEVEEFLHLSVDWISFVTRSDCAELYLAKDGKLQLFRSTESEPEDRIPEEVAERAYSLDASLISSDHGAEQGVHLGVALEIDGEAIGSFVVGREKPLFKQEDLLLLEGIVARVGRVLTHAFAQDDAGKALRRAMRAVRDLLQSGSRRGVPSIDPGVLAWELSGRMGADRELAKDIRLATTFHDVAMAQFGYDIASEPRALSSAERKKLHNHPRLAARLLEDIQSMEEVSRIVLHHHEWYNGEGYPESAAGSDIPLGSRILAAVDAFCSMTGPRRYRPVRKVGEAAQELVRFSGTQFDPEVVHHFLGLLGDMEWLGHEEVELLRRSNREEIGNRELGAPSPSVALVGADTRGEDSPG